MFIRVLLFHSMILAKPVVSFFIANKFQSRSYIKMSLIIHPPEFFLMHPPFTLINKWFGKTFWGKYEFLLEYSTAKLHSILSFPLVSGHSQLQVWRNKISTLALEWTPGKDSRTRSNFEFRKVRFLSLIPWLQTLNQKSSGKGKRQIWEFETSWPEDQKPCKTSETEHSTEKGMRISGRLIAAPKQGPPPSLTSR